MTGCLPKQESAVGEVESPEVVDDEPLRITVVDDPPLAEAIERQWQARAGGDLILQQASSDQIRDAKNLNTDVVIFPSALLGLLAERRWIDAFPQDAIAREDFRRSEIFSLQRLHEPAWGKTIYAVSLGSPQFLLAYRQDIFEQMQLKPPNSWAEYQALVETLGDRKALGDLAPAEGQPWTASVEPLADGWAGLMLLSRAAPYARHRSQFSALFDVRTMEPLVAGPPFVRALNELRAAVASGDNGPEQLGPGQALQRIIGGSAAMAITWAPTPGGKNSEASEKASGTIQFAELPGSDEAYNFREQQWEPRREDDERRVPIMGIAGRMASISTVARNPHGAANMLTWLTGPEMSVIVSPASDATTLFRESQVAAARGWVSGSLSTESATDYARVVADSQNRSSWLDALRIPGRERYLSALDKAVQQAIAGNATADEALASVAQQWKTITDELGVETQRIAYRHSLGLE